MTPAEIKRRIQRLYLATTHKKSRSGALGWFAGQANTSPQTVYCWTNGTRNPTGAAIRVLELLEERAGPTALRKADERLDKFYDAKEERRESHG